MQNTEAEIVGAVGHRAISGMIKLDESVKEALAGLTPFIDQRELADEIRGTMIRHVVNEGASYEKLCDIFKDCAWFKPPVRFIKAIVLRQNHILIANGPGPGHNLPTVLHRSDITEIDNLTKHLAKALRLREEQILIDHLKRSFRWRCVHNCVFGVTFYEVALSGYVGLARSKLKPEVGEVPLLDVQLPKHEHDAVGYYIQKGVSDRGGYRPQG